MPSLRTFAFGTPERWGAGFFPGEHGLLLIDGAVVPARLEGDGAEATWEVTGEDVSLIVTGVGAPAGVPSADAGEASTGFEQRCAVRREGSDTSTPGVRGERLDPGPLGDADSVRTIQAWFGEDLGAGLVAVRPRKAKAHNSDVSSAGVLSPTEARPITDARLSTTYTASGRPARFNLELWNDDPEAYPRRVAGESAGGGIEGTAAGWTVRAEVLAAHHRGEEGTGVYLLVRHA